jgi:hypothetical protein
VAPEPGLDIARNASCCSRTDQERHYRFRNGRFGAAPDYRSEIRSALTALLNDHRNKSAASGFSCKYQPDRYQDAMRCEFIPDRQVNVAV